MTRSTNNERGQDLAKLNLIECGKELRQAHERGKPQRKAGDHQDLRTYGLAVAENEGVIGSNMSLL